MKQNKVTYTTQNRGGGRYMTAKKKYIIALVTAVAIALLAAVLFFTFPGTATYVEASRSSNGTNTVDEWKGSQQTPNLIPTLTQGSIASQGWGVSSDGNTRVAADTIYENGECGWVIKSSGNGNDLGGSNYTGGVYYTLTLSDADRVKADLGQLSISATATFFFQASATHRVSIRFRFLDSANRQIGDEVRHTHSNYWVAQHYITRTLNETKVPSTTCSIQIWFSNNGSLDSRPFICHPICYLYDRTAPSVSGASLEKTSIADSDKGIAVAGNTIKYSVEFNEKVSLNSGGTANITLNGQSFASSDSPELVTENGKSKVRYTFTLPDKSENGTIRLSSVSGLSVKDEAGNAYTYNGSPSAPTLEYYRAMSVSSRMTHVEFSGATKATYNTEYSARLTAVHGYNLPENISVAVGGSALTLSREFTYDNRTGNIVIHGANITNDIIITASGVAKQSNVTFYKESGSGGSENTTATFDSAMPEIAVPSRQGYTFEGYYTGRGGQGTKYYDASGHSVKNCDFDSPISLYANWVANKYTIVFDSNKPSNASENVQGNTPSSPRTYDEGEIPLPENGFTLKGWTFQGWSTIKTGEAIYTDRQAVQNLSDASGGTATLYAIWKANTHKIILNAMGGNNAGTYDGTFDSELPGITVPARNGYKYLGYYDSREGGTQYYDADGQAFNGKTLTVDSDITLYARWEAITYKIQLYSEGEYIDQLDDIVFGSLTLPSAESLHLARENYDFVGWNIYEEQNWAMYTAETTYNAGLTGEEGATVVLYAAWLEKPIYSLYYDANGGYGAPSTVQLHLDESVTISSEKPERDDYTFLGWALSGSAEKAEYYPEGEFTMGDGSVTLFAVWKQNPSVTYNVGEGRFINTVSVTYPAPKTSVKVIEAKPIRDGYDFAGWSRTDGGAVDLTGGQTFTMPETDVVLYAVWHVMEFAVSQSAAEGYTIQGLSDSTSYGDTIKFTVTGTEPKVFINGTRVFPDAEGNTYSYKVTENVSVIVADASSLVLLYSANGGAGAPTDSTIYAASGSATVSETAPTRTGYKFLGWSDEKDGATAKYSGGGTVNFGADDITLYAVWEANTYTVTYSAEGADGVVGTTLSSTHSYGTAAPLTANAFTRTGYNFVGWATVAGGDVVYGDGDEVLNLAVTDGDTIPLFAIWEKAKTLISLNADGGGGGTSSLSVDYGDPLPGGYMAPVRRGYTFGGYYTMSGGDGEMLFDENMSPVDYAEKGWDRNDRVLTLYAYWIPTPETIEDNIDSVKENLNEAVEDLQSSIEANKSDVDARVTALSDAYIAADQVLHNELALADESLADDLAALRKAMEEADGALTTAIEGVQTKLDNAVAELRDSMEKNRSDLETKLEQLRQAYEQADALINDEITALKAQDTDILSSIASLDAAYRDADRVINETITALEAKLDKAVEDLNKTIDNNKTDIDKRVTELDQKYTAAMAALELAMETADGALGDRITALQKSMQDADQVLQNAIDAVDDKLDNAVAELKDTIANNKSDIEKRVSDLDQAHRDALALLQTTMEAEDAKLKQAMEDADQALQDAIDNLEARLNSEVATLNDTIATNKSDIEAKVAALDRTYQAALAALRTDMEKADDDLTKAMQDADIALQAAIDAVQDNLDNAVADLRASLAADKADLEHEIDMLDRAYKAADVLIRWGLTSTNAKISSLEQAMVETDEALETAIEAVQRGLNNAVDILQMAIDANEADIEDKVAALDEAQKAASVLLSSTIADLKATDSALSKRITALTSASRAADEALWTGLGELEKRHNELKAEQERSASASLAINIVLGTVAIALIAILVVQAIMRKKKS